MKINFLTSGFDGDFPAEFIRALMGHLQSVNRLAFVASDFTKPDITQKYADLFYGWFEARGITFESVSVVDDLLSPAEADAAVRGANVVWLAGGPTLTQIAHIRRAGLLSALREREGITIGMSAGSINMARRVVVARDPSDGIPELSIYEGIGLVDINIEPHINEADEAHLTDVRAAAKVSPIIGLHDGSFILEQAGQYRIFGPHILFSGAD